MWTWQVTSLYLQIRHTDSCLLLLLPRSPQFVFVCQRNVCGAVKDGHCLKFPQNYVYGNKREKKKKIKFRNRFRVVGWSVSLCLRISGDNFGDLFSFNQKQSLKCNTEMMTKV